MSINPVIPVGIKNISCALLYTSQKRLLYIRFLSRARKTDGLSDPEGAVGEGQFGQIIYVVMGVNDGAEPVNEYRPS